MSLDESLDWLAALIVEAEKRPEPVDAQDDAA